MSRYWKMALRTSNGGRLFLFSTSSEQSARAVLHTLTEETGCDRFYIEVEGTDYDEDSDDSTGAVA